MIGVWLEKARLSVREDLPEPVPGAEEALIRVTAAGICASDLAMLQGYRPFTGVPGHEFAGVVEDGPPAWIGARVAGEINVTCLSDPAGPAAGGTAGGAAAPCPACRAGRATHCERRTAIGIFGRDGAFAEKIALPVGNLHRIPEEISDEAASFIEPLAAAFRILEQIEIGPSTRALVVGPGRIRRGARGGAPRRDGRAQEHVSRAGVDRRLGTHRG